MLVDRYGNFAAKSTGQQRDAFAALTVAEIEELTKRTSIQIERTRLQAAQQPELGRFSFFIRNIPDIAKVMASEANPKPEQSAGFKETMLSYIAMCAATLVIGIGKKCTMPDILTEDQMAGITAAAFYCRFCCAVECMRRQGWIERFDPLSNPLESKDVDWALQVTPTADGAKNAMAVMREMAMGN